MVRFCICLLILLLVTPVYAVTIAGEPGAAVPVVGAAEATPAERFAVEELVRHLEKITGSTFETIIETELPAGMPALYVGPTRFARDNGIDAAAMGSEAWLVRTVGTVWCSLGAARGVVCTPSMSFWSAILAWRG